MSKVTAALNSIGTTCATISLGTPPSRNAFNESHSEYEARKSELCKELSKQQLRIARTMAVLNGTSGETINDLIKAYPTEYRSLDHDAGASGAQERALAVLSDLVCTLLDRASVTDGGSSSAGVAASASPSGAAIAAAQHPPPPPPLSASTATTPIDVLLIVCSPSAAPLPNALLEASLISECVRAAGGTCEMACGESAHELNNRIHTRAPRVVVFIGHADAKHPTLNVPTLGLTDKSGRLELLNPATLEAIFARASDRLELVVLNGCKSAPYCESIAKTYGKAAIGWRTKVADAPAKIFSAAVFVSLARSLADGASSSLSGDKIRAAFEHGERAVAATTAKGVGGQVEQRWALGADPSGRRQGGGWAVGGGRARAAGAVADHASVWPSHTAKALHASPRGGGSARRGADGPRWHDARLKRHRRHRRPGKDNHRESGATARHACADALCERHRVALGGHARRRPRLASDAKLGSRSNLELPPPRIDSSKWPDTTFAKQQVCAQLSAANVLVVLDDVWDWKQAEPLTGLGDGVKLALTTRIGEVAAVREAGLSSSPCQRRRRGGCLSCTCSRIMDREEWIMETAMPSKSSLS